MTGAEFVTTVTGAVRVRIEQDRATLRAVAEQTGVSPSTIHRLVYGAGISLDNLLTLADWAGLQVRVDRRRLPR